MRPITVTPRPHRVEERQYTLITPLMGGSAFAGFVDEDYPVSGKAVRGQLRFWWRALRGGQFEGSLSQMRETEEALFGKASIPEDHLSASAVQLAVLPDDRTVPRHEDIPGPNSPISYLAFALRDKQHAFDGTRPTLLGGISFKLRLTVNERHLPGEKSEAWAWAELEAALWAWEHLGGVGARTRRGFGAVQRYPARSAGTVQELIHPRLEQLITPGPWPAGVPHLTTAPADWAFGTNGMGNARSLWERQATHLKKFRRATHNGEDRGATLWPEKHSLADLRDGITGPHPFPRAALGLPIVFGREGNDVNAAQAQRLASPILFRPMQIGAKFYSLACRLRYTTTPNDPLTGEGRLTARAGGQSYPNQRHALRTDEARLVSVLNIDRQVTTDVPAALLHALRGS